MISLCMPFSSCSKQWSVSPLSDNCSDDNYLYLVTVYTGTRKAASTKSNVYFVLGGDSNETEVRKLEDIDHVKVMCFHVNYKLYSFL